MAANRVVDTLQDLLDQQTSSQAVNAGLSADFLQGKPLDASNPLPGQALIWSDTSQAWIASTVVGQIGPQGPPGIAGPQGFMGLTGNTGATGLPGPPGNQLNSIMAVDPLQYDQRTGTISFKTGGILQAGLNLSDISNASAARANLGLGTAATRAVGTTAGTVADAGAVAASLASKLGISDDVSATMVMPAGGTSARNLATVAGERKSVKDFGCVGNGTTDDGVNFQAALTWAGNGGYLFVPKGIYPITFAGSLNQLTIYGGTTLEFADGAWLKAMSAGPHFIKISSGASYVTLINPQIDCNYQLGLNGLGIGGNNLGTYVKHVRVIGGRIKGCRTNPSTTGLNSGGGRGIHTEFFVENVSTFGLHVEDCDCGVAAQGSTVAGAVIAGAPVTYSAGPAFGVRHQNLWIDNCANAIQLFNLPDANNFPDDGTGMQLTIDNAVVRNCGLAPARLSSAATPSGTNAGIIVSERARFFRISNLHAWNDPAYGIIGGFFRGTAKNCEINNCSFNGNAHALFYLKPSDALLPTTVLPVDNTGIRVNGLFHIGAVDNVLDHQLPATSTGLAAMHLTRIYVDTLNTGLLTTASTSGFGSENIAEIYNRSTMECVSGSFPQIVANANTFSGATDGSRRECTIINYKNPIQVDSGTAGTSAIDCYNTADHSTNYERVRTYFTSNVGTIDVQQGGTGTYRNLQLVARASGASSSITLSRTGPTWFGFAGGTGNAGGPLQQFTSGSSSSSSVVTTLLVGGTHNQSGTAGYIQLDVNPTVLATGSGTRLLQRWAIGGVQKAAMDDGGNLSATSFTGSGSGITGISSSQITGLGTAATQPATAFLSPTGSGAGLTGITASQITGLGTAATQPSTAFLSPTGSGAGLTGITASQIAGLGTSATHPSTDFLGSSSNLSDILYPPVARANVGLHAPVAIRSNPLNVSTRDPGSTSNGRLDRMVFTIPKACYALRLSFANHYNSSGTTNSEQPNPSTITIKAAVEYPLAPIGSSTGSNTIYPVYFGGSRTGTIPGGALLESDVVVMPDLPDGAVIGVRSYVNIPSYTTGNWYGVGFPGDSTIGEGVSNSGDMTDGGLIGAGTSSTSLYGPSKVSGIARAPRASIYVGGDSICAGTNEPTTQSIAGYIVRGLNGQYPIVFGPKAGETIGSGFIGWKRIRRMALASGCTHAILNYGTNDLAAIAGGTGTLAQLKSNILDATNAFTARGVRVRWCTILCKTTSTDGFRSIANQSVTSQETNRLALNYWLRDSSSAGYVQACNNPSMVAVFDPAALLEVNASGVVTLNGGFWPIAGADLVTGTATAGTTTTLTDSSKNWTASQYSNGQYKVYITSGTGAGQSALITANTSTSLTFAAITTAPDATSQYAIYAPWTNDGTHPNSIGHALLASAILGSALTL